MNLYTGLKEGPLLIWIKRIMSKGMSPRVYGPRRGHSLGPRLWNQGLQRTTHQEVPKPEASQSIFPTSKEEGHTHCSQRDPRITVVSHFSHSARETCIYWFTRMIACGRAWLDTHQIHFFSMGIQQPSKER